MNESSILDVPGLWRLLAESCFDGVMLVDAQRRIVYWSCQAARITGFGSDDVLGQNCLVGFRCSECMGRCSLFDGQEACEQTVALVTRSGREITVVKNAHLVEGAAGEVVGGIEVFRRIPGAGPRAGDEGEAALIRKALVDNRYNRTDTARALGMSRATLWRKMKKHDL
jgi:PAS domain S-box-containing protein